MAKIILRRDAHKYCFYVLTCAFAVEGEVWHTVPNMGFDLKVLVQTMEISDTGIVSIGRILPSDEAFNEVLQKALLDKIPKLVATDAEKHFLLLEDCGVAIGFSKVIGGIDSSVEMLPDLKKVDGVWVARTMGWKD